MDDLEKTTRLIADNLIYYRKKAGLTQLQLADHFIYSDKSVSKWERGESVPDTIVLKALADFYGITIDDFFRVQKVITSRQITAKKRCFIILLSVGLVWLIAALTFLLCSFFIRSFANNWLIFIYALIPSFTLLIIFALVSFFPSVDWYGPLPFQYSCLLLWCCRSQIPI